MFHRRLLLLSLVLLGVFLLVWLQTLRLSSGASRVAALASIEHALHRNTFIPTRRGRVLDRNGVVLAVDRATWQASVPYRVLSGRWAVRQARVAAQAAVGKPVWKELPRAEQDRRSALFLADYQAQVETLLDTLSELADETPETGRQRRADVLRRVSQVRAEVAGRSRGRALQRGDADEASGLAWAKVEQPVADELKRHVIAPRLSEAAAQQVSALASEARRRLDAAATDAPAGADAVWAEVDVTRTLRRVFPLTETTVTVDRSTMPMTLRNPEPVEIPVHGLGWHVLGGVAAVHDQDRRLVARPFIRPIDRGGPSGGDRRLDTTARYDLGGYRVGDMAGTRGVERTLEKRLRGERGFERVRRQTGGVVERAEPEPGGDVRLTLDHRLQARVRALMTHDPEVGLMLAQPWHGGDLPPGTPLHGAAVVLDIDSGEVLAAVSVPTPDPAADGSSVDHTHLPHYFRPTQGVFPPGSTVKPVTLAAALSEGVLPPGGTLDVSAGHLYPNNPRLFRDWIFVEQWGMRTFGELDGPAAIKVSSNTFFGQLAQRLGPRRLRTWQEQFGFGRSSGVGLPVAAGTLPGNAAADGAGPTDPPLVLRRDSEQSAIGQGSMTATPLQLASALAVLGRSGRYIEPGFVVGLPRQAYHTGVTPEAVAEALSGMWKSANEGAVHPGGRDVVAGTTYRLAWNDGSGNGTRREPIFNTPGVRVWGKSGTAQASPLREAFDDDGDGRIDRRGEIVRSGNHAWTVVLAGPEGLGRPTLSVVVLVEYGGSGGKAAAPIVNQILRAAKAEGYLSGGGRSTEPPAPLTRR